MCPHCGTWLTRYDGGEYVWGHIGERCKACGYKHDITAEVEAKIDAEFFADFGYHSWEEPQDSPEEDAETAEEADGSRVALSYAE